MSIGDREQLVEIGGKPTDVDRDDRLRPRGDRGLDSSRIQVVAPRVDVDEDGNGPLVEDRLPGAGKGVGGRDDLVAGLDPDRVERRMDRRGP